MTIGIEIIIARIEVIIEAEKEPTTPPNTALTSLPNDNPLISQ